MYEIPEKKSNFDDVGDFHEKFGLDNVNHHGDGPREFNPELMQFRVKFLLEELIEFVQGIGAVFEPEYDPVEHYLMGLGIKFVDPEGVDHAQAFDALLDLVYVAKGTAHLMGYPWQEGWDRVQRANMSKVRAQADGSDSKRGSSFDVVKPEGWKAPDIEGLLRDRGWDTKNEENTQ